MFTVKDQDPQKKAVASRSKGLDGQTHSGPQMREPVASLQSLQRNLGNGYLQASNPTITQMATDVNGLRLQRACACGSTCAKCAAKGNEQRILQPKLTIGSPNDRYEQEADRIADQVMQMPEPSIQRQMEPEEDEEEGIVQRQAIANQITPLVQRQVLPEMEDEEEEVIQTKTIGNQAAPSAQTQESSEVPHSVHEVLRSPGQPLDPATRAFMEPRFGHDFSRVRVHTGTAAERSTQELSARAYTVGHNIVFGVGRFIPGTHEGRRLLAHELTHTAQQNGEMTVQRAPADDRQLSQDESTARHRGQLMAKRIRNHGKLSKEARAKINRELAHFEGAAKEAYLKEVRPILRAVTEIEMPVESLSHGAKQEAAKTSVSYEDDEAKVSVLATEDEAADRSLDIQEEADARRAAAGVTDAATVRLDEKAWNIEDAVKTSVARQPKSKREKSTASSPNSSPDLRNASAKEIRANKRTLLKAQILSPDARERARLGLAIENTKQAADTRARADAAKRKTDALALMRQITKLRADIESLQQDVVRINELRKSTTSLVTGPTHAYGGAWEQMEITDFQDANIVLTKATEAVNIVLTKATEAVGEGNFSYAELLLRQSAEEYVQLASRFEEYSEGIQRGGGRVIRGLEVAKIAGKGAAKFVAPGFSAYYDTVQDAAGIASMDAFGLPVDPLDRLDVMRGALGAGGRGSVGQSKGIPKGGGGKEDSVHVQLKDLSIREYKKSELKGGRLRQGETVRTPDGEGKIVSVGDPPHSSKVVHEPSSKPRLISNPKHHPKSASPEPANVTNLYKRSIEDASGVRWTKGTDGVIHRFSAPSNGESHWNGSTAGPDAIRDADIPVEIREALK